jgi:hypothetical protein
MANFPRLFPTGTSLYEGYPSDKLETHDIQQSQSVNGDEGSDHEGYVTLGGVRVSRLRRRIVTTAVGDGAPSPTIVVNGGLGSANSSAHRLNSSGSVDKSITLDFQGVVEGDEYLITLHRAEGYDVVVTLSFAGTGITHRFSGDSLAAGSDEQPPVDINGRTIWRGFAVSATEVWWTAQQVSP